MCYRIKNDLTGELSVRESPVNENQVISMKNLRTAIECLAYFATDLSELTDIVAVRKLYKKAALVVHSDRAKQQNCPHNMTQVNAAWEIVCKARWEQVASILGLQVKCDVDRCWTDDPLHNATVPAFYTVDTLCRKAWNICDNDQDESFKWFGSGHCTYFQNLKWQYEYWSGSECMLLTDLQNALLFRKECVSYRIVMKAFRADMCKAFYELVRKYAKSSSPEDVIQWLHTIEMVDLGKYQGVGAKFISSDDVEVVIYRQSQPSHTVFTPFDIQRMKPLTELPKKWTIAHLRRVIANGQFVRLKQDYYLTDDYAYDAAVNYRKGYISNPFRMLAELIGDDLSRLYPTSADGQMVLHFGCHSNDGRSITIDLNCRYPAVDMSDEESIYLQGPIRVKELVAA